MSKVKPTSLSFNTQQIKDATGEVAKLDYWGNVSNYIQDLIVKDLVARGYDKAELMLGAEGKKRNVRGV